MASFVEAITVLAILVFVVGLVWVKAGKKMRKQLMGIGVGVAIFGAIFGGLAFAGVPGLLTTGGTGGAPQAGALWAAALNSGSDTDRTETELIAPNALSVLYILSDANMDGLGDVDLEADVFNKNTGKTTDVWGPLEISISTVGTAIVSGVATPVANYTTDRTRFNIAYSLTTAGAPTLTQVHDRAFSYDWTTGSADEMNMDLPIDPAVADDVPAGGSFIISYVVGGITLTATIQES